jgi:hypothetical protein
MPIIHKIAVTALLTVSFFSLRPAYADSVVTLASVGTAADAGQTNSNGATVTISPNSAWAAALPGSSWVSYAATGNSSAAGYVQVPNGTVVNFSDTFTLASPASSGTVTVMADDSATVLLNGLVLLGETTVNNTYKVCSDFGIGCLQPTIIDLPVSLLSSGSNTLEFQVAQHNGSSFGLDYLASITEPTSTPESASGLLLVLGLGALALLGFFRKSGAF